MTNLIVNGGFEAGISEPPVAWVLDAGRASSTSYSAHSGNNKCQFEDETMGSIAGQIHQDINVAISRIKSFNLWYQTFGTQKLAVTITYSDTTTVLANNLASVGSYAKLDILALLDQTKTVLRITIAQIHQTTLDYAYIDDVDLEAGGTGAGGSAMNVKALGFLWFLFSVSSRMPTRHIELSQNKAKLSTSNRSIARRIPYRSPHDIRLLQGAY